MVVCEREDRVAKEIGDGAEIRIEEGGLSDPFNSVKADTSRWRKIRGRWNSRSGDGRRNEDPRTRTKIGSNGEGGRGRRKSGGEERCTRKGSRLGNELARLEKTLRSLFAGFSPPCEARKSREGIRKRHLVAGGVLDPEVVVAEEFAPPRLSPGKDLRGVEVLESFVVGVDRDGVRVAFAVHPVHLERFDDGQHLLVMDLVVEFVSVELARVEGDGMVQVVVGKALGKDCCQC